MAAHLVPHHRVSVKRCLPRGPAADLIRLPMQNDQPENQAPSPTDETPMAGRDPIPPAPTPSYSYQHSIKRKLRDPRRRSLVSRIIRGLVIIALIPVILTPLYLVVPPVSTLMLWRWATFQRVERSWMPISEISPALIRAVIAGEDGRYCTHWGVDWREVQNAIDDADDLGDARGASTIPMQTAKNLFLWPGRQFIRKALEVPLALYMNAIWPKRRMMEIYLNIAEWGPDGEFGVEAAARRAFSKSARDLTAEEAALLAGALPNPHVRHPGRPGPQLARAANTRLRLAVSNGPAAASCVLSRR
jgi:monofunctional biosynthetic peptidoglycan transglycosylase